MNPRVVSVEVEQKYILKLAFENDEVRLFDASPFLEKGIFNELKDFNYFKRVRVAFGSIEWPHESGNRGSLTPSPHNTLLAGPHRAFHLE